MGTTASLVLPIYQGVFAILQAVQFNGQPINVREDHAPDAAFPYLIYNVSFPEHGEQRGEGDLELHAWGNNGAEEVILLLDACVAALDRVAVLNSALGVVVSLPAFTPSIGREGDGATRHGVQHFRLKVQKPQ